MGLAQAVTVRENVYRGYPFAPFTPADLAIFVASIALVASVNWVVQRAWTNYAEARKQPLPYGSYS